MTSCNDPELRRQVREELLFPAYDPRTGEVIVYGLWALDPIRQARAMADRLFTVQDIAYFQGVSVELVRRRLGEAA